MQGQRGLDDEAFSALGAGEGTLARVGLEDVRPEDARELNMEGPSILGAFVRRGGHVARRVVALLVPRFEGLVAGVGSLHRVRGQMNGECLFSGKLGATLLKLN